jgi:hypothetical protein
VVLNEAIYRTRKDGELTVPSRIGAIRVVEEAARNGYHFGYRQTVAGWLVLDLDN